MEELRTTIAKNISSLRQASGMTQAELAQKLNYSDKAVSKWERAESIPDVSVLRDVALLFGVTVDYLLTLDHVASLPETSLPEKLSTRNHTFITAMSIVLVWLVATFLFVLIELLPYPAVNHWMVFVYSVPISIVVWLVFNSIWFNVRRNFLIISLLMWSTLASIHISFLPFQHNVWLIFVTAIPGQIIILLWSKIHYIKRPRKMKAPKAERKE